MGIGNLTRNVGMNQSTRGDRKTLGEAQRDGEAEKIAAEEKFQASKRAEKRVRKEVAVTNITEDIRDLVTDFAAVEAELKVLNERRAVLKAKATEMSLEHGIDDFSSTEGKVQVIVKKPSATFDKKKAKGFMTDDQYKSCCGVGKVPAPTVKFVPPKG